MSTAETTRAELRVASRAILTVAIAVHTRHYWIEEAKYWRHQRDADGVAECISAARKANRAARIARRCA